MLAREVSVPDDKSVAESGPSRPLTAASQRAPGRAQLDPCAGCSGLNANLGDVLGVEVALERFGTSFGAITGILDAPEWELGKGKRGVVDRHHAALDCRANGRGRL